MELLPEDVHADVLRRLPPRSLATSRCVCKAWHAIIDARRLLRSDLLPHSLGGIFVNFNYLTYSELFRPLTRQAISSDLTYAPGTSIHDHCNGLVLLDECVVNPATRRWAPLPTRPPSRIGMEAFYNHGDKYLVFDPTVASHYEVFLMPRIPWKYQLGAVLEESEWPPSPFILPIFSSKTGHWEVRSFVREGNAAGTIADMLQAIRGCQYYGVYLRGALYVHCEREFFCKISSSDDKYKVIKRPVRTEATQYPGLYLGKSKNEVQCALENCSYRFRVWILDESCGPQHEWVLKYHIDLKHQLARWRYRQHVEEPWMLEDVNYCDDLDEDDNEEETGWNSCYITFLGVHPSEDVVFLSDTLRGGMACHLNSSSVQCLRDLHPRYYSDIAGTSALSFPYTPCWMEELSENN